MLNNMNATKRRGGGTKRNIEALIVIGKSDDLEHRTVAERFCFSRGICDGVLTANRVQGAIKNSTV
jgi:hypothetical protein